MSLFTLFVAIALILALMAALGVPSTRVGLFPLAFAVYMLALIIGNRVLH